MVTILYNYKHIVENLLYLTILSPDIIFADSIEGRFELCVVHEIVISASLEVLEIETALLFDVETLIASVSDVVEDVGGKPITFTTMY